MTPSKKITWLAAITSLLLLTTQAQSQSFSSGERQVSLIELYTSEGCSSCPPADAWLRALRDDERLWTELVPVALHVDYWDYIGWEDRFADPAYSRRQRHYVQTGAARQAYTPEFFVNGKEWFGWFRQPQLELTDSPAGKLDVTIVTDDVQVRFTPHAAERDALRVHVALLGMGLASEVNAGENRGRTLRHDFVALDLQSKNLRARDGSYVAALRLPQQRMDAERLSVAVWVTGPDDVEVLQSTGGYLQ